MDTNTISRTRAHRPGSRIIAAVITALIAFFVPVTPALAFDEVFDSGHIDAFYVTAPDGQLHLSMQEDVTGSHRPRPGAGGGR